MSELDALFPVTTTRSPDGRLHIAGWDVGELARQYGTPLYVYDGATVRLQVDTLKRMLKQCYPGETEVTYAAKAYFSLGVARKLAEMGIGVDVVSLGEMKVARQAGFTPDKVHQHGNNKSRAELEAALRWGVQAIVVDSLEELGFLEEIARGMQRRGRIWLRVTPGLHVNTHPYRQTAHATSKFGLLIQDGQAAEAIAQARASEWLELSGLHAHLGSQFFEPDPFIEAVETLTGLADETGMVPAEFSPGGGWGVRYTPDDPATDPQAWIETVCGSVQEAFGRRGWVLPRLIVEPGRFLVAQAGVAVYGVGTSKVVGDGTRVVAVDGGMADNPRPALYRSRYSAELANRAEEGPRLKTSIVGKFCETGDVLIQSTELPELRRGDLLAMPAAGAYQLSMASNYNLAPRPAALWLEEERAEVLQRREEPDEGGWWVSG